jgi:uncharacterized protein (DUF362 family)
MVYPLIRDLLKKLDMDEANIGTKQWNPFKEIIKPVNNVVIKPNLVTSEHPLGKEAIYCTVVHGSIIRPIIDYVALALKGEGSIVIADNPMERADFPSLMAITGIKDMAERIIERSNIDLKVMDLRPKVLKENKKGKIYYESHSGDPMGYITVDLGSNSLFAEFDKDVGIHYYTLADHTIDHFDPKCNQISITDRYHNPNSHKYVVSKSVLNADVVIDIAKMKTHCKAGVSLSLKNMIGIVYLKDCMPHHRPGFPPKGDAFPHYPAMHYVASRKLYRNFRNWFQIHRIPGFRRLRNFLQNKKILLNKHIEHGNWRGNDTIWRTILDLNRISVYADKDGVMRNSPQRKFFYLIDGVVAQQGEGPMSGEPKTSSIVFGGFNPVVVDSMAIKAMGIDLRSISTVYKANRIQNWKLMPDGNIDVLFSNFKVPSLFFALPKGWISK